MQRYKFENYVIRSLALETIDGKQYRMERPRNINDGQLEGVEIGYRQFYDFLPGWLNGFGLEANGTYMHGGLTEPDGKVNSFAGMSKWAYNLIGLYERGDWSARVAYSWRSRFVSEYAYRATQYDLVVDPMKALEAAMDGFRVMPMAKAAKAVAAKKAPAAKKAAPAKKASAKKAPAGTLKPSAELAAVIGSEPVARTEWLVDTPQRLNQYREIAHTRQAEGLAPLRVNLELDVAEDVTLSLLTSHAEDSYFTFQDYNRVASSTPATC